MARVYNEFAPAADVAMANSEAVERRIAETAEPAVPARPKTELEKSQEVYRIQIAEVRCGEESRCLAAYERLSALSRDLMLAEAEEAVKVAEQIGGQPEKIPLLPEFVAECAYLDVAEIRKSDVRKAAAALERVLAVEARLSALMEALHKRRAEAEAQTVENTGIKEQIAELERRRLDAALHGLEHVELDAQILALYQQEDGNKRLGRFAAGELAAIEEKTQTINSALEAVTGLKTKVRQVKIAFDACVAAVSFNAAAEALAHAARDFEAVKAEAEKLRGSSVRLPETTLKKYKLMIPVLRYRWSVSDGNGGLQRVSARDGLLFCDWV